MKYPNAIRNLLRGLAVSVLALSALAMVMELSASVPSAPEQPAAREGPRARDAVVQPEAWRDSPALHEAHADGGYRYWFERQLAP